MEALTYDRYKGIKRKDADLAIRGKLVPQDPNDEPASVLLERIRQQKQQIVKEGKLKAEGHKKRYRHLCR